MDAIKLHDQIVTRYKDYIGSFIDIRDADIADKVAEGLRTGKLWPDPLIQFNPAYEQATSIDALVKEGVLQEQLAKVFSGYRSTRTKKPPCAWVPAGRASSSPLEPGRERVNLHRHYLQRSLLHATRRGPSVCRPLFSLLKRFADSAPDSFQYIVTTTEEPPSELIERHVVSILDGSTEEGLLFGTRF